MQVLASFPANFLFPFATAVFMATGISLNMGRIVLMALGAQWYILFNVIAGASAIPTDLREAMANLRLPRVAALAPAHPARDLPGLRHRRDHRRGRGVERLHRRRARQLRPSHLVATGLGAYIAQATATGDFPRILIGVVVMSIYVVALNRLFWRRLYALAERRYTL